MDNLFNSGISIEKMAAYLDGNLSASEMHDISKIIEDDAILQEFVEASDLIEDDIALNDFSVLPDELSSMDFDLPNIENFSGDGDIFEENNPLYHQGVMSSEDINPKVESHSSLVDEILDELNNETMDEEKMSELDFDVDSDADDIDMDDDLLDIDI